VTADERLRPGAGRLATWCGWVLIATAALTPILGWIWPLGFPALISLAGLACLPAVRIPDEDRPVAIVLFAALIWAAVTAAWSPYHPSKPGNSTILKLALQLPLYWSAVQGARAADPRLRVLASRVMAWGGAAFGAMLIVEAFSHAAIYRTLHVAFYEPIRPDLAESQVGHASFILGLLWPLAAVGGPPRARPWLALVMVAGVAAAALAFGSDAPVLALLLAPVVALAVWRWPAAAPQAMAMGAAGLYLTMPLIVGAVRRFGDYAALQRAVPLSYAERMGYWSHAIDWIGLRQLQGWGLDASRMFGPGIKLHPHNDALQIWLELGAVGAVLAAAFWGVTLMRLIRPARSLPAAAAAASATAYLLFGLVNFGVWQEWWLALGALSAMLAILNASPDKGPAEAP
jgi:O-antigen ligase